MSVAPKEMVMSTRSDSGIVKPYPRLCFGVWWSVALLVLSVSILTSSPVAAEVAAKESRQNTFVLDESLWVLFYDLPSRRFRLIRDNYLQQNFDAARANLLTSENYVRIEAGRATYGLKEKLEETAAQLHVLSERIDDPDFSKNAFDPVFARTHWLLAQHFLLKSLESLEVKDSRMSGHYLLATTHHLERTVLWSDMPIRPATVVVLDRVELLANELLESKNPARVWKKKPILQAWRILVSIGEYLDRPVHVDQPVES